MPNSNLDFSKCQHFLDAIARAAAYSSHLVRFSVCSTDTVRHGPIVTLEHQYELDIKDLEPAVTFDLW